MCLARYGKFYWSESLNFSGDKCGLTKRIRGGVRDIIPVSVELTHLISGVLMAVLLPVVWRAPQISRRSGQRFRRVSPRSGRCLQSSSHLDSNWLPTGDTGTTAGQCWANVCDVGPALGRGCGLIRVWVRYWLSPWVLVIPCVYSLLHSPHPLEHHTRVARRGPILTLSSAPSTPDVLSSKVLITISMPWCYDSFGCGLCCSLESRTNLMRHCICSYAVLQAVQMPV